LFQDFFKLFFQVLFGLASLGATLGYQVLSTKAFQDSLSISRRLKQCLTVLRNKILSKLLEVATAQARNLWPNLGPL
jgi:hypothetical protein